MNELGSLYQGSVMNELGSRYKDSVEGRFIQFNLITDQKTALYDIVSSADNPMYRFHVPLTHESHRKLHEFLIKQGAKIHMKQFVDTYFDTEDYKFIFGRNDASSWLRYREYDDDLGKGSWDLKICKNVGFDNIIPYREITQESSILKFVSDTLGNQDSSKTLWDLLPNMYARIHISRMNFESIPDLTIYIDCAEISSKRYVLEAGVVCSDRSQLINIQTFIRDNYIETIHVRSKVVEFIQSHNEELYKKLECAKIVPNVSFWDGHITPAPGLIMGSVSPDKIEDELERLKAKIKKRKHKKSVIRK